MVSDGRAKGNLAKYCRWLGVSRQGLYKAMKCRKKSDRHADLVAEIRDIIDQHELNDNYGKRRILEALMLLHPDGDLPSASTIYRVMRAMGLQHRKRHKPNGITKADREARKSDDLLKRNFITLANKYSDKSAIL